MIWAAIETSTLTQSLALAQRGQVIGERVAPAGAQHGRVLAQAWSELLRDAGLAHGDVEQIVVGAGPGSFTGLRIGLAFARGVSLVTGARVALVSSVVPLARRAPDGLTTCVALDARRGEVYAAIVGSGAARAPLTTVDAWRPADLVHRLADFPDGLALVGGGFAVYGDAFAPVAGRAQFVDASASPNARIVLEHAIATGVVGQQRGALEPSYVRGADADAPRTAPMDATLRRAVLGEP